MEKNDDVLQDILSQPEAKHAGPVSEIELDDQEQEATDELDKEDVVSMVFSSKKAGDKYKEEMIDRASKDPESVKVKTPMGWMTMLEAAEMGFDPKTGKFNTKKGMTKPNMDESFKDVPEDQKGKLKQMMDRKNTNIPPGDLEQLGAKGGMFKDFLPGGNPGAPAPGGPPLPGPALPGQEEPNPFEEAPKPGSDVLGGIS